MYQPLGSPELDLILDVCTCADPGRRIHLLFCLVQGFHLHSAIDPETFCIPDSSQADLMPGASGVLRAWSLWSGY